MRRTFEGWLRRYCCELTGLQTTSVKKLCRAVASKTPHAAEVVFLYALDKGKGSDAVRLASEDDLQHTWSVLESASAGYEGRAEAFLRDNYEKLDKRVQGVLDAYDSIDARAANSLVVKQQMSSAVVQLLDSAGVTRYRLCKDLGLNEGNVYAWLAGDPTKVSRATARKIWEYAEACNG